MVETAATSIMDEFPKLRKYKPAVFFALSLIGFLIGLIMCTNVSLI